MKCQLSTLGTNGCENKDSKLALKWEKTVSEIKELYSRNSRNILVGGGED